MSDNRENLHYVLEKAERDRFINYARQYYSDSMFELIKQNFGVNMYIPDNYKIRTTSDDMVWISQEYPASSKGFFIYKYPYEGKQSLTAEALIKARNRFASRIPGPVDGSYMITVDKISDDKGLEYVPFHPDYRTIRIGDHPWVEMVGLWDVENYFMGGPFVSFSTLDDESQTIKTILFALYAPEETQRGLMGELEYLIYTVK